MSGCNQEISRQEDAQSWIPSTIQVETMFDKEIFGANAAILILVKTLNSGWVYEVSMWEFIYADVKKDIPHIEQNVPLGSQPESVEPPSSIKLIIHTAWLAIAERRTAIEAAKWLKIGQFDFIWRGAPGPFGILRTLRIFWWHSVGSWKDMWVVWWGWDILSGGVVS